MGGVFNILNLSFSQEILKLIKEKNFFILSLIQSTNQLFFKCFFIEFFVDMCSFANLEIIVDFKEMVCRYFFTI